MTIDELLEHYKSGYRACLAIGKRKQNFTKWKKKNHIPYMSQLLFEQESNGALKAEFHKQAIHKPKEKKEVTLSIVLIFYFLLRLSALIKDDH